MVIRLDNSAAHDHRCPSGSSAASTKASVAAAFAADPSIDSSAIVVMTLGPIVILEGYVAVRDDRDTAVRIAESIVGEGKVQDRMLCRHTSN